MGLDRVSRTVSAVAISAFDSAALLLDPDPLGVIGDGMLIGYARIATRDQNLHRQFDALSIDGCTRIFQEKLRARTPTDPSC